MIGTKNLIGAFILTLLVGCDPLTQDQQLTLNKPTKVAETNGVTLWKVRDETTPSGQGAGQIVYFTTPSGDVIRAVGKHQVSVTGAVPPLEDQ